MDTFADDLERAGYAPASAVRYIRAAAHIGCFVERKGGGLADIDSKTLDCRRVGFLDAAMRSKPVAEGGHESWGGYQNS